MKLSLNVNPPPVLLPTEESLTFLLLLRSFFRDGDEGFDDFGYPGLPTDIALEFLGFEATYTSSF